MSLNHKSMVAALAAGTILVGTHTPVGASLTEKQQQVQENKKENEQAQQDAQNKLNANNAEISAVQKEINEMDAALQDLVFEVVAKRQEIKETEKNIQKFEADIVTYKERMSRQETLMKERMAVMQRNGGNSINWAEFIFGSTGLSDMLTRMLTAGTIQRSDQALFDEYEETKKQLEQTSRALKKERETLVKQEKTLQSRQKELETGMKKREARLKELEKQNITFETQMFDLQEIEATLAAQELAIANEIKAQQEAAERERQERLAAEEAARKAAAEKEKEEAAKKEEAKEETKEEAERPSTSTPQPSQPAPKPQPEKPSEPAPTGKMFIQPTTGRFTQGWGPASGQFGYTFHNGVDIANSVGTPIVASATGTVIKALNSGPYGKHVMIAHVIDGQVWTTVYAHMSSLAVSTGQRVTQGTYLGGLGNTGNSSGPHLHFEIHKGTYSYSSSGPANTVNPRQFF